MELLLQALFSIFPFTKVCIYYSTEAPTCDIIQIQLFSLFSPFSFGSHCWVKFLHGIVANMNVENQEQELCTTTSNELWFFSIYVRASRTPP
jgi:hypothetical protein